MKYTEGLMTTSLYEMLKAAGCEVDSHESDLYVKETLDAERVLTVYETETGHRWSRSYFMNRIDGKRWIELPFAFEPFWKARGMT